MNHKDTYLKNTVLTVANERTDILQREESIFASHVLMHFNISPHVIYHEENDLKPYIRCIEACVLMV